MRFIVSLLLVLLVGCATPYTGRGPNFNAANKAAEYSEFKLANPNLFSSGIWMNGELHTRETLLPIVNEVSPLAHSEINAGKNLITAGGVAAIIGIVGFSGGLFPNTADEPLKIVGSALILSGIGLEVWGNSRLKAGVAQYNYDLRNKLGLKDVVAGKSGWIGLAADF